MILMTYLDRLPQIPEFLLNQQEKTQKDFQVSPTRTMKDGPQAYNLEYIRWALDSNLKTWITDNICNADNSGLQVSRAIAESNRHLPHTDSYPRSWALNYTIDTGGNSVVTRMFKEKNQPLIREPLTRPTCEEDLELINSFTITPYKWWLLNSSILHDVIGVTGTRITVSLGISSNNPFTHIHEYKNYISVPT